MNKFKVGDKVRRIELGPSKSMWRTLELGLDRTFIVKEVTGAGLLKLNVGEISGWSPGYFTLVNSQIEEYI